MIGSGDLASQVTQFATLRNAQNSARRTHSSVNKRMYARTTPTQKSNPADLREYYIPDFKYEDYCLLIRAGKGDFSQKSDDDFARVKYLIDRGLVQYNYRDEWWLTKKGAWALQAVGYDPKNPHEFANTYGHLLDKM